MAILGVSTAYLSQNNTKKYSASKTSVNTQYKSINNNVSNQVAFSGGSGDFLRKIFSFLPIVSKKAKPAVNVVVIGKSIPIKQVISRILNEEGPMTIRDKKTIIIGILDHFEKQGNIKEALNFLAELTKKIKLETSFKELLDILDNTKPSFIDMPRGIVYGLKAKTEDELAAFERFALALQPLRKKYYWYDPWAFS